MNEELLQKIVDLQNQINNMNLRFSSGQYSNTILQTKEVSVQRGGMQSQNFVTGSAGWRMDAEGNLEANTGTFRGALVGNSLDIGGDDATSAHLDSAGNLWLGASIANKATAPARISNAGAGTFSNMTITGGAISGVPISGIPNSTVTDISLLEKTHNLVFSVTDADTIAWTAGTIVFSNGRTFAIDAGNTGNMSALTYIYLDTGVSSTVLQTTTTYSTAIGANKSLLGMAKNNTVTATFIPYGAGQPLIDGADIGALSILAGNIAASTITSNKMSVSQLSAIAADLGTITAGSININSGVASISSAGAAVFKSIQVGGSNVQYTLNDSGIFSFGDGSDGDVTISADTTLTSDKYYHNLTVNSGKVLKTANWRVFCSGTLTNNGTIECNGNNATNAPGSTSGTAIAAGYFGASAAGGAVNNFPTTANIGGSTTHSLGTVGGQGGTGGANTSPAHNGMTGGAGGTATASYVKLIANWHLSTLLDINIGAGSGSTVLFTSGGGGGDGGYAGNGDSGEGGGGGSAAGVLAIYAKVLIIGATGSITVTGGNGGNGSTYGGGGGGGGAGGIIILVYNTITNSGSITALGGTHGNGAAAGGTYNAGGNGADGSTGVIYQFNLAL